MHRLAKSHSTIWIHLSQWVHIYYSSTTGNTFEFARVLVTPAAKFIISFSQSCHWFHALKITLDSEKQRADDTEKKYSEVKEISEERRKKLEETEKKVQQLQESLQR